MIFDSRSEKNLHICLGLFAYLPDSGSCIQVLVMTMIVFFCVLKKRETAGKVNYGRVWQLLR